MRYSASYRPRPAIECARCGDPLFVSEWSEHVDADNIRHLWRCESCDHVFETTVSFAAA
jgi:transcription elongation factor Elf1